VGVNLRSLHLRSLNPRSLGMRGVVPVSALVGLE
jgi:hypothetical protein